MKQKFAFSGIVVVMVLGATYAALAQTITSGQPSVTSSAPALGPIRQCLVDCTVRHSACVGTNQLRECFNSVPSCRAQVPQTQQIIRDFCGACGMRTDGCSDAVASTDGGTRTRADGGHRRRHDAGAPHDAGVAPVADARAPDADASHVDASVSDADDDEDEIDEATACAANGFHWDPDFVQAMSDDAGTVVHGYCWPPGPWQNHLRINNLDNRIGVSSHPDAGPVVPRVDRLEDRVQALEQRPTSSSSAPSSAAPSSSARPSTASAAPTVAVGCNGEGVLTCEQRGQVNQLIDGHTVPRFREDARRLDALERRPNGGPSVMGIRASVWFGVGFQQLHSTPANIPYYVGGELDWSPLISAGWNAELGAALGYAGPNTANQTHIQGMYHLGFIGRTGHVGIGFGGILMERMNMSFASSQTLAGGYLDFILNIQEHGWSPTLTIRGVLGPVFTFTNQGNFTEVGGSIIAMLGIAHFDEALPEPRRAPEPPHPGPLDHPIQLPSSSPAP